MADTFLGGLLLVALLATAVLYWTRVVQQMHDRRLQRRLGEIRRLTAVVRATLAEARRFA